MFSLFHGQSAVERGFSVNKETIDNNMLERTIVSRRIICDSVAHTLNQKKMDPKAVYEMEISPGMLKHSRSARNAYKNLLDSYKDQEKRKLKHDSLNEMLKTRAVLKVEKRKLVSFEKEIEKVSKEADTLAMKAERKTDFDLLTESNQKRKRVHELKNELSAVKAKVQKLEEATSGGIL